MGTTDEKSAASVKTEDSNAVAPAQPPKAVELDDSDLDKVAGGKAGGKGG